MAAPVQPIAPMTMPRWAYQTVKRDWKRYRRTERPWTWDRLKATLWPSLDRPLFVLGAPRSGTTFLGDCIGALPAVSYHFEPVATKAAARLVYDGAWSFERAQRFYRTTYRWLLRIHGDGDLRFAEKTPRNAFIVPFLRRAFPAARFIHIIRDGRDAALSHSKKPWLQAASAPSEKHETGGYPFGPTARFWVEDDRVDEFERTTDFHRCIWAWRRHVESILDGVAGLPETQYHTMRYETFVRAPHDEADRLLDFLGISSDTARELLQREADRARTDSVQNWRTELTVEQHRTARREAGPLLRQLGYQESEPAPQ